MRPPRTALARDEHGAWEIVLAKERQRNARRVAVLRAVLLGAFFANWLIAIFVLGARKWGGELTLLSLYLAVAVGLWLAVKASDRVASVSSPAIPFLDIPALFLIFRVALRNEGENYGMAILALAGLYLVMILLTVPTLRAREVALTGAAALGFELALLAGVDPDTSFDAGRDMAQAGYLVLLTVTFTAISLYVVHRLLALVRSAAEQRAIRERLRRFFSPEVAALLERCGAEPSPETREITVLCTDLQGFTTLSQTMASEDVMALLNEVHGEMARCVFEYGGTLDKFMGDGLLAYFNAPLDQPDHATRAVRCAGAMQAALEAVNARRHGAGEPALRMGIGIHTGRATLGILGPDAHREYTAIGETVNVAAHVEHLTRRTGNSILLSEATRRALDPAFAVKRVPETPIPGVSGLIALYHPLAVPREDSVTAGRAV